MGALGLQLEKFKVKVGENQDKFVRGLLFRIGESLIYRSPVGAPEFWVRPAPLDYQPGSFRGEWQYSQGAPATSKTNRIDPGGGATLAAMGAAFPVHPMGRTHYFTNLSDYAVPMERGYSPQAGPGGIVGATALNFDKFVSEAAVTVQ